MSCYLVTEGQALILVRTADDAADAERLRREATMLARAAHPGVVALAPGGPATSGQLRTRAIRGRPLAVMDQLEAAEIAGLGAVLATTVADLHDGGIVHGAIDADHVLVTAAGQPILTGFGDATLVPPPAGPEAAADVLALRRTLLALPGADDELRRLLTRASRRRPRARSVARALVARRDIRLPARGRQAAGPAPYALQDGAAIES